MKQQEHYKIQKYSNIPIITKDGQVLTKYQIVKLLNKYHNQNKQLKREKMRRWKKQK